MDERRVYRMREYIEYRVHVGYSITAFFEDKEKAMEYALESLEHVDNLDKVSMDIVKVQEKITILNTEEE